MIYPKKISSRVSKIIINSLGGASIIIAIIIFIVNKIMNPEIPWAPIANIGIIYVWATVIYSIKRNTNIAAHVLLQTVLLSFLTFYIDKKLGFPGWSIYIGIPIIIMIANITMLVLSIVCHNKYTKYAMYQLFIVIFSMIPIILSTRDIIEFRVLNIIATGISIFNFTISIVLSYKAFYKMLICKFHM